MRRSITPEEIDALLPQTQCGLCGFGGCMPYAEAMVFEGAAINLCPPGGTQTLSSLANLLNQDAAPLLEEMAQKTKPPLLAFIREAECIGCTKCIQVCPVDAILGAAKQMHTVISDECTGCELCVPVCPVDCIDMLNSNIDTVPEHKKDQYRRRYQQRSARLKQQNCSRKSFAVNENKRKSYIEAALARVRAKQHKR